MDKTVFLETPPSTPRSSSSSPSRESLQITTNEINIEIDFLCHRNEYFEYFLDDYGIHIPEPYLTRMIESDVMDEFVRTILRVDQQQCFASAPLNDLAKRGYEQIDEDMDDDYSNLKRKHTERVDSAESVNIISKAIEGATEINQSEQEEHNEHTNHISKFNSALE